MLHVEFDLIEQRLLIVRLLRRMVHGALLARSIRPGKQLEFFVNNFHIIQGLMPHSVCCQLGSSRSAQSQALLSTHTAPLALGLVCSLVMLDATKHDARWTI